MKILHLADTHIGYSAYNRLDESGLNQREVDVYNALAQVVDAALAEGVDLVIHAGDLFDTVRPSNRAISFAIGQLLRLSSAGIPTVIISGNHSTPRLRETGSVFRVFEHIEHLHLAYTGRCQAFEFGDLKVHALPHGADRALFDSEMNRLRPDSDFGCNIAVLHAGVTGLGVFRMNEFNELMAATSQLERGFDYVALGHYHEHVEISENVVYAGSTERFGFGEVGQPKGFVILDPDAGEWEFRELDIRPMLDLPPVDCRGMKASDITNAARGNIESGDVNGAVVRQVLLEVERRELSLMDIPGLRKLAGDALHFELRPRVADGGQSIASEDAVFDSLEREFAAYLSKLAVEGADPEKLKALGMKYLADAGGDE